MAKPDPSPESYLNLSAATQFELAQRIDDALLAAENAGRLSQETQCFQLWLQQFYDLAGEEFNTSLDVPQLEPLAGKRQLTAAFRQAIEQLMGVPHTAGQHCNMTVKLALSLLLERSLLDALDFMHGQGSWRFDIQRSMQDVCKDLQTYSENFPIHT